MGQKTQYGITAKVVFLLNYSPLNVYENYKLFDRHNFWTFKGKLLESILSVDKKFHLNVY